MGQQQRHVQPAQADYGITGKMIAALVIVPTIAVIGGIWLVMRVTSPKPAAETTPTPRAKVAPPVAPAKPAVQPVAVQQPMIAKPPPEDPELRRLREENAQLRAQVAALSAQPPPTSAPLTAAAPSQDPSQRLKEFDVFAKRFAEALGKCNVASLNAVPKSGGPTLRWEANFSVTSTDIQSSPSLAHPIVFVATLRGMLQAESSDWKNFEDEDFVATFAQSGSGWVVVKAVQKTTKRWNTGMDPLAEEHPNQENDVTRAPYVVEAASQASKAR